MIGCHARRIDPRCDTPSPTRISLLCSECRSFAEPACFLKEPVNDEACRTATSATRNRRSRQKRCDRRCHVVFRELISERLATIEPSLRLVVDTDARERQLPRTGSERTKQKPQPEFAPAAALMLGQDLPRMTAEALRRATSRST